MIKFTKEQVLNLYKLMTDASGGTIGVRDISLLESALEAPFHTFFNQELYPSLIEKAARLGYGLVANHPFVDGNKRIGVFVMLTFLKVNKINISFTNKEIENMALNLADGTYKYEDILNILKNKHKGNI